jgi:hypothetical protein
MLLYKMAEVFTCGIDVGTVNMCVSFVSNKGRIVVYYGPVLRKPGSHEAHMVVLRYPAEPDELLCAYPRGTLVKDMSDYHGFVRLLRQMKEFVSCSCVVIESQVAMNCAKMSRLDGILFGYLSGIGIRAEYKGGGCRDGFVGKALVGVDTSEVELPKLKSRRGKAKEDDVKKSSYQYVGHKYPEFYAVMMDNKSIDKYDDICDSILYANIASTL